MRVSLNWINELVNIRNINLEILIEKLTLGGFEVEDIFQIIVDEKKDIILEISATANRTDSISINGISKEIAALTDQSIQKNSLSVDHFTSEQILQTLFAESKPLNIKGCSDFIVIRAENIENLESPKWLKQKLLSSGIQPTNSLSDFQNYLLLETGYPFEFYDFNKIKKDIANDDITYKLTTNNKNSSFIGVNDVKYELTESILTVNANDLILSVGGIIQNKNYSCDEKTSSFLIEATIFDSKTIRQTSRNLGIRTERSARYEKELNNSCFIQAICRLLNLLKINNPKINYKIENIAQITPKQIKPITLTYKNVIEILGPVINNTTKRTNNLSITQISNYLKQLEFDNEFEDSTSSWSIKVPAVRSNDVTREIDIIEEIGRLHGFNNFVTELPNMTNVGKEDISYQARKKLITCFLSEGLTELVQYSLVENQTSQQLISLINPLTKDVSQLRTTLLIGLLQSIESNLKQGNRSVEGFEFGHIFSGDIEGDYSEKECISGVLGGFTSKSTWSNESFDLSWFEAKGKINDIFSKLQISIFEKQISGNQYETILHPHKTITFYSTENEYIGIFGQVHPNLINELDIPLNTYLFELDFEFLKNKLNTNQLTLYKPYSSYPKIVKDLSIVLNQTIPFSEIRTFISEIGTDLLTEINLLDEYKGDSIPLDKTSLCIQLVFQSSQKTLRTEEVEKIVNLIVLKLTEKYQIMQRI
jgi:phenylalanyl-tRNA synthetase beta chain